MTPLVKDGRNFQMPVKYKLNKDMKDLTYSKSFLIKEEDTALHLGSGDLNVLSTPSLIASMENAAMNCAKPKLQDGFTTVGTLINIRHLKACKVGQHYIAKATLMEEDGRKLVFKVEASDEEGNLLGEGTHERFIVDSVKFMNKI
jgi:predicted thioesterase